MRIIAQDGSEYPYEDLVIWEQRPVSNNDLCEIKAERNNGNINVLGIYKNRQRCEEVRISIREYYIRYKNIQYSISKYKPNDLKYIYYFRMPKE